MISRFSVPRLLRVPSRDVAIRVTPTLLVFAGLVLAAFSGWADARGSKTLLVPIAAVALYIILAHTTLIPFAAVLLLGSTFADAYALPRAGHFYPVEFMVILALALLPFSNHRSFGGGTGVLMVVLLGAIFGGIEVARVNGISTLTAIDQARSMVLYASFWVALAALRANPARFLKMLAVFAVGITLLAFFAELAPAHSLFVDPSDFLTPDGSFTRVRPPGLVLVYFALIFAVSYLLWGPPHARRRALSLAAVAGLGVLLSLNRNMLVGAALGLVAVLIVTRRKSKTIVSLGAIAIAVTVLLSIFGSGAIGSRILSLGNPSKLESTTLSDRAYEDSYAVPVIERHLIFGIGWGANYGAELAQFGTGDLTPRGFIHNQYYGLLLRTGIVGLVAYLGLLGATAMVAIRWIRSRGEHEDVWLGAALLASAVAFAASSIVGIYVIDPGSTPIVASLFALGVLMREQMKPA